MMMVVRVGVAELMIGFDRGCEKLLGLVCVVGDRLPMMMVAGSDFSFSNCRTLRANSKPLRLGIWMSVTNTLYLVVWERIKSYASDPLLASAIMAFSNSLRMHRFITFKIAGESSTSSMDCTALREEGVDGRLRRDTTE